MRLFIGKRVHLPVIGGLYVGASFPFHPSRVGTGGSGYRDGVGLFLFLCFLAGPFIVYFLFGAR